MKYFSKNLALAATFLALTAFVTGCSKDDDHNNPVPEQELITTFALNLEHPTDPDLNKRILFKDLDGEGGMNGAFGPDTLQLLPNTIYKASLFISDESNAQDIKDITTEIREEAADHQFFYFPSAGLNITVSNLDLDENQKPLGLRADVTTGIASRGTLRISLHHYAEVAKDGVTPSSETDIEVDFPVKIQ